MQRAVWLAMVARRPQAVRLGRVQRVEKRRPVAPKPLAAQLQPAVPRQQAERVVQAV